MCQMSKYDNRGVSRLIREIGREREWLMDTGIFGPGVLRESVELATARGGVGRIAEDGGGIIAFACIWPFTLQYEGFDHAGRLSMGVAKPYRRQGIGQKLLEAVLAATKFERVELEVFEHNEAAIELYRKFGFETEGVKRNARFLDGKYMNIVLMARLRA